jgi:Tetratricopeptide repeat
METRGGDVSLLRLLCEQSARGQRIRRRAAASAGAAVLFGGLLIASGLARVLLIVIGLLGLVAAVHAARERGGHATVSARLESLRRRLGSIASDRTRRAVMRLRTSIGTVRGGRADSATGWPLAVSSVGDSYDEEATVEMAAVAPLTNDRTVYGRPPLPTRTQIIESFPQLLPALQRRIRDALVDKSPSAATESTVLEVQASRCNELGVALRRAGCARQAATLHRAARLIFAGVGDGRGEALAANALGVALVEAGEQDSALEQFEEARTLLRKVGDRHWEGKVLANIGLAKHRVGQDDEALRLLQSALDRLSPETAAYRLVERRLRRAS